MKRSCLVALYIAFLFTGSLLSAQDGDLRPDSGLINGRRYMNGYFGFSYRFPEGWAGSAARQRNVAVSQMYPLFSANPQASGASDVRYVSINADFLAQNSTVKSPKEFLELAAQTLSQAFEPLHTDKRYVFGGKQFYRVDMKSRMVPGAPVVYQTQISTFLRSYAVTFSFMASNSDDMEELVRTMGSLAFFEPGLPVVPSTQAQVAEKSDSHSQSEEKPAGVPAATAQIANVGPIAGPANAASTDAQPRNVEPKSVVPKNAEPIAASSISAPIATLAAKADSAPHAVPAQNAGQSRATASQAAEHPGVANSFVASAPRTQTASSAPATQAPTTNVEARTAPAGAKAVETPAQPAQPAMTETKVAEPAPPPRATTSQPAEMTSGAAVGASPSPGQVQVTTVSSSLPDQIQPLAAPAASATPVRLPPMSANSADSSRATVESTAPAKAVANTPSGAAASSTQKKVYIPASLASSPSPTLPARVSVVSADEPAHVAPPETPPSTLIEATHRPSNGNPASGSAAPVLASAPSQSSSASMQKTAPSTTITTPPAAEPPAAAPEPKVVPSVATLAMNTSPVPTATTAKPSRVQVSTAVLEANLTRKTMPAYPMVAKSFRVEGLVVVDVVVDRSGNVLEAKAVSGPQLLLRGAEASVRQWHFKPYMVDGAPVEMESQVSLNFRLSK